MTDLEREFNGRTIEDLCRLGDAIIEAYGPAFREQKRLEQARLEQNYHDCTPREADYE